MTRTPSAPDDDPPHTRLLLRSAAALSCRVAGLEPAADDRNVLDLKNPTSPAVSSATPLASGWAEVHTLGLERLQGNGLLWEVHCAAALTRSSTAREQVLARLGGHVINGANICTYLRRLRWFNFPERHWGLSCSSRTGLMQIAAKACVDKLEFYPHWVGQL
eukprot:CAMPEP_0115396268 /NCGR_PEP_ID=MMETSP0271-20121206/13206_1 /TAXON_ID=71861 /ORGANISM="Scrippsiella trochoidea, Strain CCMP3099" /LENGTH=161 /DNA_ID=CAMNT_0002819989 /DNA_START=435 /DNA_END=921 /DNA_ORIENTATION=+